MKVKCIEHECGMWAKKGLCCPYRMAGYCYTEDEMQNNLFLRIYA